MAVAISSFEQFEHKFEQLKYSRDLFAFFLFDDRPSHEAIERFAEDQFDWLDSLAASARIFFFVFIRRDDTVQGNVANPSLEVARMFGIPPNRLPGVVLFTLSEDQEGVSDGVYVPLKAKLFGEDIEHVEEVFSDIFTLIQECQGHGGKPAELLVDLQKRVKELERKERTRPVMKYLRATLVSTAGFPGKLLISMSEAFAQEAARRVLPG